MKKQKIYRRGAEKTPSFAEIPLISLRFSAKTPRLGGKIRHNFDNWQLELILE